MTSPESNLLESVILRSLCSRNEEDHFHEDVRAPAPDQLVCHDRCCTIQTSGSSPTSVHYDSRIYSSKRCQVAARQQEPLVDPVRHTDPGSDVCSELQALSQHHQLF